MKQIYAEMIKMYPDLVEIGKDKSKRKLKPLVLYKSDLDALEADMVKHYGSDTSHVPVVWKVNESRIHDDTFANGIPTRNGDDDGDADEDGGEEDPSMAPKSKDLSPPLKKK